MAGNFASILREWAMRRPDAPALTFGEETWTFGALNASTSRPAQALIAEGVRPGDRIGVLSRNCAEFIELIFACSKAGAIAVGINWRLAPVEIDAIVTDAEPTLVFVGPSEE